jgi:glycerol-3-phosphate dehydrogenase
VQTTDQETYDVAVIGAGVSGAAIARELSRFRARVILLEKEADVSFGTSKANSGIIHGGFHHHSRYLKTRLEIEGSAMFDRLHRELGFPFERCGILVAAMHHDEMRAVEHLYLQGKENGAVNLELCSRARMLDLEPKLSLDVAGGLYAPMGGIVEPYRFVFALVENACANGLELRTQFRVAHARREENLWYIGSDDGRAVRARFVVNAAGLFADEVSAAFGAEQFQIEPRRGEYFLLDRLSSGHPSKVIFPVPSSVSKGMLVIPTVEGTTLIGPTADSVPAKDELATTPEGLSRIADSARRLMPSVSERDAITSFAGLRPALGDDFYIELSKLVQRFVQVAGIQSPGLTAAPATALRVLALLREAGFTAEADPAWNPVLPVKVSPRHLDPETRAELVRRNPAYGNIVCRCEEISEAEIVDAIAHGHTTLDGVKFYTRAQMGRCQGGFCSYRIIKIIMRETGLPFDRITKRGGESRVLEAEL